MPNLNTYLPTSQTQDKNLLTTTKVIRPLPEYIVLLASLFSRGNNIRIKAFSLIHLPLDFVAGKYYSEY